MKRFVVWWSMCLMVASGAALAQRSPLLLDAPPPPPMRGPARIPDVYFVPTPPQVVQAMLSLARVGSGDIVYDLGCGDGRIVIEAARQHGARGVGIDIDPERIDEANANARQAGVTGRVQFRTGDLYEADLREATVVSLYLLPDLNLKLRPKLRRELKPGARVVSHEFDMGDWRPDEVVKIGTRTVYLWTVR